MSKWKLSTEIFPHFYQLINRASIGDDKTSCWVLLPFQSFWNQKPETEVKRGNLVQCGTRSGSLMTYRVGEWVIWKVWNISDLVDSICEVCGGRCLTKWVGIYPSLVCLCPGLQTQGTKSKLYTLEWLCKTGNEVLPCFELHTKKMTNYFKMLNEIYKYQTHKNLSKIMWFILAWSPDSISKDANHFLWNWVWWLSGVWFTFKKYLSTFLIMDALFLCL